MRSDIVPGGTFPDHELPDHTNEAWDAGDWSPFHGWDKRAPAAMPARL